MLDPPSRSSAEDPWQVWIDVGGTFTDCVARSPSGELWTAKVLSTAAVKGRIEAVRGDREVIDPARSGRKDDVYRGFQLALLDRQGGLLGTRGVVSSKGATGALLVDAPFDGTDRAVSYELRSPEEAPLLAIREVFDLRLDEPAGALEVRLGTTRGTNALLERKGARTAFLTTRGFGDVLLIGYQDRPRLFDPAIEKPPPLFESAAEVRERLAADGGVLEPLDEKDARTKLRELSEAGLESVAIALLHAHRNPEHERRLEELAREAGFSEVSVSSRVSPAAKLVPRGDTTVADAYLTPVIGSYIERIRSRAPEAKLRLLTSAGGLANADSFRGVESVLSGPAGGVVGAARAAERAGFRRAIGFDMGGTSTDVCRWDGDFEMEFETRKAGVRLAMPLLAIETVAAGGGSICSFDGERMTVGPASAGARPGPACYGAGGPLTLTDVDFFLGRVPEDRFPFPLDRQAVRSRLDDVARELQESGHARSAVDIASGFARVADARMAQAIRKVSVARGYDVREYALVAFGGAGGQHACAVARELGVRSILVPVLAGLLSAHGAGLADTRKFVERSLGERWDESAARKLREILATMEEEARLLVLAEGIARDALEEPRPFLLMRYAGQDAALAVEAAGGRLEAAELRRRFEEEHRRLYGYAHGGREVEVVGARVECAGRLEDDASPKQRVRERGNGRPALRTSRSAVFEGREVRAAVLSQDALEPGESLAGPAVVLSPHHTVVVEPGWSARRNESGDLVIERAEDGGPDEASEQETRSRERMRGNARSPPAAGGREKSDDDDDAERAGGAASPLADLDPVRLEIFHRHFAAIAEEMGIVLRRSALSTNIRERLDFSCAVFDAEGGIVANAPHIPVHLGALGECVKHVARDIPSLADGDVVVTNDPFRGGSHLPDVTVVTPVFERGGGAILFWVASRAHHAEIGGVRPGSMSPDSRNLEEEGVLIRSFRVIERGRPRLDELRRLLETARYPSRRPEENIADVEAQVAANRAGTRLFLELIASRGKDVVLGYMKHIQDASRRLMESRLRELPGGASRFTDYLDDGSPLAVAITVADGRAAVDFTGTGPVLPGNLNATPAIVSSAVLYSFRLLLGGDVPLNSGVLAPLRITLPECFLNPPARRSAADCAAVAGGNVETSQRVVDALLGALEVAAASQGTMNNLLFGNRSFSYYETIAGGAGAGKDFDGADAVHTHMTNTRITDPEVLESRYPVRLRRFAIRRGSGGAGAHRGGDGCVREIEFLEEVDVSIVSQRRTRPPWGLAGGSPGAPGRNLFRARGETGWRSLPPIVGFTAPAGSLLRIETPGGGGWGKA